ncbi:hypothetical protein Bsel_0296 [[Bacillus] selenitireducens MLS10]|uniref:Uncharacterized protein n=1 Tax=Bacillus selenitireducens (strain ATCC 700615 / DSM 15326 / MLS10) TaxID=439292 RepID=D6XWJ4_BACIE|nr:hypothetical protein Bsel_0296 [[Bacillus] selenitireducens MLS10]
MDRLTQRGVRTESQRVSDECADLLQAGFHDHHAFLKCFVCDANERLIR